VDPSEHGPGVPHRFAESPVKVNRLVRVNPNLRSRLHGAGGGKFLLAGMAAREDESQGANLEREAGSALPGDGFPLLTERNVGGSSSQVLRSLVAPFSRPELYFVLSRARGAGNLAARSSLVGPRWGCCSGGESAQALTYSFEGRWGKRRRSYMT